MSLMSSMAAFFNTFASGAPPRQNGLSNAERTSVHSAPAARPVDPDDVEARRRAAEAVQREVRLRGACDARDLARTDGLDRAAEAAVRARAHLDEDDDAAVARDEIDLGAAEPDVARDDLVAEPAQDGRRGRLGGAAARRAGIARVHPRDRSRDDARAGKRRE